MSGFLNRNFVRVQKIGTVILLLWCAGMVALILRSGAEETKEAVATGKRFIVYTEDGRVEGAATAEQKPDDKAKVEAPPAAEPAPVDASAVTAVQASATPIPEVMEEMIDRSSGVALPRISSSGLKPWQYYVKTYHRPNELPMIAIIVTGLGQAKHVTDLALSMDERIGLSFSPYSSTVGGWAAASRMTGHEMYVDLPMQTSNYPDKDPGPYSMLLTRSNTENIKNLFWAMSRFQGYAGLVAPVDEVLSSNNDTYQPLTKEIARRGVLLLVAHPPGLQSEEESRDRDSKLVQMNADVWIDEELTEMSIQARLATLEQIAQRNGFAVGIAQAYPLSLTQIKHWQKSLGERGIEIAPLSFITKLKSG